jgi:hypothetical protein
MLLFIAHINSGIAAYTNGNALQEKNNLMMSVPSATDNSAEIWKPSRPTKRALNSDPADEDTENENRKVSQHPSNPKRRANKQRLPTNTVDDDALPAVYDRQLKPKQRQKPGPKPGFKYPTKAESPPPWSWDVISQWTLTCPQLNKMLGLDDSASHLMIIRLANDPRHTKVGRQYWATFEFGNGCLIGNMRFCPHMDSSIRDDIEVEDFEKACVLKNGEWVGPPPNGIQKWNLRWRGVDPDTGVVEARLIGTRPILSLRRTMGS